ncbi:hypothetical protein GVX81_00100 [[Haemophilus] felis]|uniref:Uncharacterized protein n=1 Tax=[Haemophilus] felis TaxID=123822 RepID=A0A1T0B757_9PAST|nr:hypothetical protein [[Haemophilus] felis]NBI41513.1 hypothetical protein [[Haemophilus] felis]NBI42225.1 hypothetical protein [[Haemophilus] felis]OOS05769.1 hypothetical protein B0188_03035 [[Haemophilus] felis]
MFFQDHFDAEVLSIINVKNINLPNQNPIVSANHVKFLSSTSLMTASLAAENEPINQTTGNKKAVSY